MEKIEDAIRESRERETKANTIPYKHSDIVAAQDAAYLNEPRFRDALECAVKVIDEQHDGCDGGMACGACDKIEEIERILAEGK